MLRTGTLTVYAHILLNIYTNSLFNRHLKNNEQLVILSHKAVTGRVGSINIIRCCRTQVWLEEVLGWYSAGIWVTSHIPLSQDGALTQPSNTPATVTGTHSP